MEVQLSLVQFKKEREDRIYMCVSSFCAAFVRQMSAKRDEREARGVRHGRAHSQLLTFFAIPFVQRSG